MTEITTTYALILVRIAYCGLLGAFLWAGPASARYLFLSGDPRLTLEQLINDWQAGNVDTFNLSAAALRSLNAPPDVQGVPELMGDPAYRQVIERLRNNARSFNGPGALGKLKKVCPAVIVKFPKGSSLAFRTSHERGVIDWTIAATNSPEIVESISYLPVLLNGVLPNNSISPSPNSPSVNGGVPKILPYPGENNTILPSVELDCREAGVKSASDDELRRSCAKWPFMC
jgi:hypothetical protein